MTDIENYHNWLRDAHAMEKQAESLLVATIRRLDNEPHYAPALNNISMKPVGNCPPCRILSPATIFPLRAEGCDEPGGGVGPDHWHHAARR
jgi:hypothetical protein